MTEEQPPRLSVGLAVYNGDDYLAEAIDSILGQTFTDFELIISDNASTDRTADVCAEYAARDPRIRYVRNPTNIGGANNENATFLLSRGEYFRWAAHDDVCEAELFERCIDVLDRHDDVVLCYTRIVEIDGDGREIRQSFQQKGTAARPSERFRELAARDHACEATYGVIRSSALRSAGLQRNYTDSDRVLLAALGARGRFVQIDEPLFRKRYHEKNIYVDWRARMNWFRPGTSRRLRMPNWLQAGFLVVEAVRAPVEPRERARCVGWAVLWAVRHARSLVADVVYSVRSLVRLPAGRWRYNWE
jgi:glycosyltransferase involved in cell wall biosynthesis